MRSSTEMLQAYCRIVPMQTPKTAKRCHAAGVHAGSSSNAVAALQPLPGPGALSLNPVCSTCIAYPAPAELHFGALQSQHQDSYIAEHQVGCKVRLAFQHRAGVLRFVSMFPPNPTLVGHVTLLFWPVHSGVSNCPPFLSFFLSSLPVVTCRYEVDSFEQLAGADARKVILFLAVMAVHAVGEGGGVGVSFAGDRGWAQVRDGN